MIKRLILGIFAFQGTAAATLMEPPALGWTLNESDLRSALDVPLAVKVKAVSPTWDQILMRIYLSQNDPTVEKVGLFFQENNSKQLGTRILKIAKRGSEETLLQKMTTRVVLDSESKRFTSEISKDLLPFIDPKKVQDYFSARHYQLTIPPFKSELELKSIYRLIQQTDGFLSTKKRLALRKKAKQGLPINVEEDLLPEFAKKFVKQFNIVKGPNCFHAALSFQGERVSRLPFVNAKREEGYDPSMINHDELWTTLQNAFYEVNPVKSELKYGDILVFSELDKNRADAPFDFRRVKHASTYLFGGYMFSKGSKSANSPYTIKPLSQEWAQWQKDTKILGVKVFRRAFKNVRDIRPVVQELF